MKIDCGYLRNRHCRGQGLRHLLSGHLNMKIRVKGFTLVELMITIALAVIVLTMGVPSFQSTVDNNRLVTQANQLVGTLHFARSEAIKRRIPVTVRKSDSNWEDGWIAFSDLNGDGNANTSTGNNCAAGEDCILRVVASLGGKTTLRGNNNIANRVTFNSTGFSTGFNGTFTLCDSRGAQKARGIIISNTGRVRRATDSNKDGIEEDGSGNPLTCPS